MDEPAQKDLRSRFSMSLGHFVEEGFVEKSAFAQGAVGDELDLLRFAKLP